MTSGGHYWRPVQTCSLQDLHPSFTHKQHENETEMDQWRSVLELKYLLSKNEPDAYLPHTNKVWGKVIFSEACVKNSVHRGDLPQCMLGYHPPPGAGTHPLGPGPLGAGTPGPGTPWTRHPLDQAPPGPGTPWTRPPP